MRRIALILLAGVLALSAVEWETEQITNDPEYDSYEPVIAVAPDGSVRIVFTQWGDYNDYIKVASNKQGSWDIESAAEVDEAYFYSADVDPDGNTFVAFAEWVGEDTSDVFLASDKEGAFTVINVTNDEALQDAPVVIVDNEGEVHLLYSELIMPDESFQLFYGYLNDSYFEKEQVTENIYQEYYTGYELVLVGDEPPYGRHVFYIGDDGYLWNASVLPISASDPAGWLAEAINDIESWFPSVRVNAWGAFHVAYDEDGEAIHYITNQSGVWQDELVTGVGPHDIDWRACIDLDPKGVSHVVWLRSTDGCDDLWYANKLGDSWVEEAITNTPDEDEWPAYGRYFAIDAQGYGHVVYDFPDDNEIWQIFYAKTKEPLIEAIAESSPQIPRLGLEIRGSSIYFSLQETSCIRLDLYDAAGRRVDCLAQGSYPAGEHSIPINSAGLSAGVYFVHLESTNLQASARFVLTR